MSTPPPEFDAVVMARRTVARGVDVFEFAPADGSRAPAWTPGSHVDVLLPTGLEKQYSLCGSPGAGTWSIAVLREDGGHGGSRWIHENLAVGATVRLRGPWNHFGLAQAERYRFVAGGIGITPLLPMIAEVDARGADWTLDYAGRSRECMAFAQVLGSFGDRVTFHAADEGGRVSLASLAPAAGEAVFACGPKRMLDELEELSAGWPAGALHMERFEAKELTEPVLHQSFEVELMLTGTTITVEEGQSILEAASDAGAFVLSSCREGTCGTCETVIIEGEADHRDSVLSPAEQAANDRMMICVSRAACPKLVLEL